MTNYIDIVMNSVESSNIAGIGYNEEHKLLAIQFKTGLYHYSNVPKEFFNDLMKSESKGAFLARNIKDKYKAEKISSDEKIKLDLND